MLSRKNISKKVFFFVVFNVLILFLLNKWPSFRLSLTRVTFAAIAPIQDCAHHLTSVLLNGIENYIFFTSVAKENKFLKEELNRRKVLHNKYIQTEITNSCLRDLLAFKKSITQRTIAAEVISRDTSHVTSTIIINKGSTAGIIEGAPVITLEGVIGNIIRTTENYSQVMLITDPRSSIDALVENNNIEVVAEGCGNSLCSLEYLFEKCNINIGDLVVSSGLDKVFPKGLSIGKVSKVFHTNSTGVFERIIIEPCVNFDTLQNVIIVVPNHNPSENF